MDVLVLQAAARHYCLKIAYQALFAFGGITRIGLDASFVKKYPLLFTLFTSAKKQFQHLSNTV